MKQKILALLCIISLVSLQTQFAFAQVPDTTVPVAEPAPTEPAPVVEPSPEPPAPAPETTPAPEPESAQVEEIIAPADTAGPAFVSVAAVSPDQTDATVIWTTNEPAYGYVEYGGTTDYGMTTSKSTAVTFENSQAISNLAAGTTYHYRIVAEDESGNISSSQDRTLETAVEIVAADNVPPEITDVSVSAITASAARVGWSTNELARGRVEYGLTENYGLVTTMTGDYAAQHSLNLSALAADSIYHYRIIVADEAGNEFVSPDETFTTSVNPATEKPAVAEPITNSSGGSSSGGGGGRSVQTFAISQVETNSISTSTANILWNTNEPATSQVFYGVTGSAEGYASSSSLVSMLQTSHGVTISGLNPGTAYFYEVVSKNSSGQVVSESGFEFTTLYEEVILDDVPTISNVLVESVGTSTASIVWNTDVPASGELAYGTTTAYGQTDGGHDSLLIAHRHVLSGLVPGMTYNFQPMVWDEAGNEALYENLTFTTQTATANGENVLTNAAVSAETGLQNTVQNSPGPHFSGGGHISFSGRSGGSSSSVSGAADVLPLDSQVLFLWPKLPATSTIQTLIIKKMDGYPTSPSDGITLYQGTSGTFTDNGLANGSDYFYSVFRVDLSGNYSAPTNFTVTPQAGVTQAKLDIVPPVVQNTPIYAFDTALQQGNTSQDIANLQVLLASAPSLYPEGLITGYYGELTKLAIIRFQATHGLQPTGIADLATLGKLQGLSTIEHVTDFAAQSDYWDRDIEQGMTGEDVAILQYYLADLGYYPEAQVTGYFGPLTEAAVINFQKAQALSPAGGYFGPATQERLINLIRLKGVSL